MRDAGKMRFQLTTTLFHHRTTTSTLLHRARSGGALSWQHNKLHSNLNSVRMAGSSIICSLGSQLRSSCHHQYSQFLIFGRLNYQFINFPILLSNRLTTHWIRGCYCYEEWRIRKRSGSAGSRSTTWIGAPAHCQTLMPGMRENWICPRVPSTAIRDHDSTMRARSTPRERITLARTVTVS